MEESNLQRQWLFTEADAAAALRDPPSFALESFDPIGRWRARYPSGATINPSGELTTGEKFDDNREAEAGVHAFPDGSAAEVDRPQIESVAGAAAAKGRGLPDLMELVVLSDAFRRE